MLGDELSDTIWNTLSQRMQTTICPGCDAPLERAHISLQPVDERLYVICTLCKYAFFDDAPNQAHPLDD
jgi:RNase P subunit RPR2